MPRFDPRKALGERFADVWVLLADTDRFLSRARLMDRFESRVRHWRRTLQRRSGDRETIREVKKEIVAFRKTLRAQGWELRLGSMDVAVRGFRSDDAAAVGFRRLVLLIGDGGVFAHEGSANHIDLEEELRDRLRSGRVGGALEPHYLWYRIAEGVLEIAGADSEDRDSFEHFRTWADANKSVLVKVLGR